MGRAARRLVLVNDLVRNRSGYVLAWLGTPLLSRCGWSRIDGPRSVEGAFTTDEALSLAAEAGLDGATVVRRWPCRFLLTWRRPMNLDEAAARPWEVLVVGAGPAGTLAAREVARRGVRVLLVDRAAFPRSKVCGSCLNGRALAALTEVGLGNLVEEQRGVPLTEWRVAVSGRSASVVLPEGRALSREVFDASLVESARRAGVAFLPRTRRLDGFGLTGHRVVLQQGEQVRFVEARLVLAADGLGGQFAGAGSRSRAARYAHRCRSAGGHGAGVLRSGHDLHGVWPLWLRRPGAVGRWSARCRCRVRPDVRQTLRRPRTRGGPIARRVELACGAGPGGVAVARARRA